MERITLKVPQISCSHCVNNIRRELSELPGVQEVLGDVEKKEIQVLFGPPADLERIKETLKEIGYPASEE